MFKFDKKQEVFEIGGVIGLLLFLIYVSVSSMFM
jgi:tetrahydromethanopterin S-methyltransferase subunit G